MRERSVEILQMLMVEKYPIAINELANEFDVSSRTIRSNVNDIDNFLSRNSLPLIETIRNNGIKIPLTHKQKNKINVLLNDVEIDYYSNKKMRILNLILELVFGNKKYVYDKQNEFKTSKSTKDNDMKTVREILHDYNLSLNTQCPGSLEIEGVERTIRVMIFNVINKYVGSVDIYDMTKMQSSMYQILFDFIPVELFEKISNLYEKYITYDDVMYKNQTILFLSIWINRLRNEKSISGKLTDPIPSEDSIDLLINEVEKDYAFLINESERNYGRLILETLVPQTVESTSEWTKGQILTLELISHVQHKLNLTLNNKEELFSGLFKHIVKLMGRLERNMQIRNPLMDEIKNNNPKIFEAIKTFPFNESDISTEKITDDEIAFIAIYFLVSMSQVRQNYNHVYKAVVFCNHGKATGRLLSQMLEENFDIDVVAILSSNDLTLLNKIDADIAFSTIYLDIDTIPLLVVDSLLIDENHKKVKRFLNDNISFRKRVNYNQKNTKSNNIFFKDILKIIKKSNGDINEGIYNEVKNIFEKKGLELDDEVALPNLSDLLMSSHILFDVEALNWKEAITNSAESLLEEEIINEKYIDSMIESVKKNGPYIVMGPHVALAHAKPEDGVNEVGVSVSLLKNPINFDHEENDPVKIVFCIAPTDSYSHINIMNDIYELMNNEEKMHQLLNSENKNEFKQLLFN